MLGTDLLRFVIAALGLTLAPAMTWVLVLHWRAFNSVKNKDKALGLLPKHVMVISASYAILTYGLVMGVLSKVGEPGNWRLWLYLVGFILGLYALWIMATRQRRRITFARPAKTTVITYSDTITQED